MRINTDPVFLGMKAAAPIMIGIAAANGTVGSIVNLSSVRGLRRWRRLCPLLRVGRARSAT
ncbi:MAG: hypothetical protein IPN48_16340 [Sphingomonadales bacterium]|nr:hypothetical protein [Sphingomonadales bacterium]